MRLHFCACLFCAASCVKNDETMMIRYDKQAPVSEACVKDVCVALGAILTHLGHRLSLSNAGCFPISPLLVYL